MFGRDAFRSLCGDVCATYLLFCWNIMAPTATAPNGTDSATTKSGQNVKNLKKDPIDRTWRGNNAGTITMDQRIPKCEDPYEEREWIKVCSASDIVMFGRSYETV